MIRVYLLVYLKAHQKNLINDYNSVTAEDQDNATKPYIHVSNDAPKMASMGSYKHTVDMQTVLQYTEEQEQDLMHLRRLFYGKIGQLCRERRAILKQMGTGHDLGAGVGLDDVSVRLSEVSNLAERLQANGADEYRTYMQFTSAFLRGVSY